MPTFGTGDADERSVVAAGIKQSCESLERSVTAACHPREKLLCEKCKVSCLDQSLSFGWNSFAKCGTAATVDEPPFADDRLSKPPMTMRGSSGFESRQLVLFGAGAIVFSFFLWTLVF